MKRIFAVIVGIGMFLPLLAAPVSCDTTTAGPTFLKLFTNPECYAQYSYLIKQ